MALRELLGLPEREEAKVVVVLEDAIKESEQAQVDALREIIRWRRERGRLHKQQPLSWEDLYGGRRHGRTTQ